jgi:hypothetical protein
MAYGGDSGIAGCFGRRVFGMALVVLAASCSAVYPEVSAPVRVAPAGRELAPPPPEDLLFITFKSAEIPERTRDGRKWDSIGGSLPDPFAKLFINDKVLITTPVHSNTLKPTWPEQKRANYRIAKGSRAKLELWNSNELTNHPICIKRLEDLHDAATNGQLDVMCDSGARLTLTVERAHARMGLGLYYELRTEAVFVTRVIGESPAAREGLSRGDEILRIQGKEVKTMDEGEAKSLINTHAAGGVLLTIRRADGSVKDVTIKDGPMYPLVDENIKVD